MSELHSYIIPAIISGVVSGILTACIQSVVDNWLADALKQKENKKAIKISLFAIIFAVISCIVFVILIYIMLGTTIPDGESSQDDNSITTLSMESTTDSISTTTTETTTTIIETSTTVYEESSNNNDIISDYPFIDLNLLEPDVLNIVGEQRTASPGEIIQYHVRLINNPGFTFGSNSIKFDSPLIATRKEYEEVDPSTAQDGFLYSYDLQIPSTAKTGDFIIIHISIDNIRGTNGEFISSNIVEGYISVL